MNNNTPLKTTVEYVPDKIPISSLNLDTYITTDNILQNKKGVVGAVNLPPNGGRVTRYSKGNILVANIRPYLKKIWFANKNGGASADVLTFRVNKGFDPKYIYYALFRDEFFEHMMRGSKGSKMPRGDKIQILDFSIPNYSIEIQRKISSVLATLDSKIELNNQISTELEKMAKLIYDYWFVQFDFPDENGKPYKFSGGKMVWNAILKREIPEEWEVQRVDQIESNIVTGKTPSTKIPEYFDGDVPFICIGDVRGNMHIVKTESTLSKKGANVQKNKYIPRGAICVTCIASPGLIGFATEPSQTNQQLNSIICVKIENKYYLYFYLQDYFKFAKAKTGNTFANMNKEDFSSIKVINPPKNILLEFSKLLTPLIENILNCSKENHKLAELRDWLLPMLMNGQVRVGKESNYYDRR